VATLGRQKRRAGGGIGKGVGKQGGTDADDDEDETGTETRTRTRKNCDGRLGRQDDKTKNGDGCIEGLVKTFDENREVKIFIDDEGEKGP
jgi:hypothetical protein